MPTRMLRDGILTSERIAELAWDEEVFYRRLMSVVDDYGRFHAHKALIRAACYPLLLDKVADSDIEKWLSACVSASLVGVYPASDGKRYIELLDFGQRIQGKSKFPPPCSASTVDNRESRETTAVVVVEDVVVVEGGKGKSARTRKSSLPADFCISERVRKWAEGKGYDQLEAHFEVFVSKASAKGYTYADWDSGFMGAVREDWAKLRIPKAGASRKRKDL